MKQKNFNYFHLTAAQGKVDNVKFCIKVGVNIDTRDKLNRTPLHYAAMHNRVAVAKALLAAGACANARDKKGITPYHIAVARKHNKIINIINAASKRKAS